jgi:hypothetical protein
VSDHLFLFEEKTEIHYQTIQSVFSIYLLPAESLYLSVVLFSLKKWMRAKHLKQKEV